MRPYRRISMNKEYRIPPHWARLSLEIITVFPICIGAICYSFTSKNYEPLIPALFIGALCVALIYSDSQSWIIDEKGIICLRFGKPYKSVSWQQVKQVGIAIVGGPFTGGSNAYIIVTLDGAEKFNPKKDVGGEYMSKWKDSLIGIYKSEKAISAFKAMYGEFEYICNRN